MTTLPKKTKSKRIKTQVEARIETYLAYSEERVKIWSARYQQSKDQYDLLLLREAEAEVHTYTLVLKQFKGNRYYQPFAPADGQELPPEWCK